MNHGIAQAQRGRSRSGYLPLLPRRLPLRSECRTHPHVAAALPPVGTATMPGYPVHSYPAQLADSLQDHHRSGGARAPALHAAPGWRPPASL